MKKKELNNLKKQVREVSRALKTLSDEELTEVLGGIDFMPEPANIDQQDMNNIVQQDMNSKIKICYDNFASIEREKRQADNENAAKPVNILLFPKDKP